MTKEDFTRDVQSAREWMDGLLAVWSDGQLETDEIVSEWTESFKNLTGSTREALQEIQAAARQGGYTSVSDQLAEDIARLDEMDAEIARLLKKRQSKLFSEDDKIRLEELIDAREAIEVKYKLVPADTDSFETIRKKVEAEVARAQARGLEDADVSVYENAIVAAAEGMAAVNQQIDEQYDKEYAVIQLIEDSAERSAELEKLNSKYVENRRAAAKEYAETLASITLPVWEQEDIQATDGALDQLYTHLREYSIAASNNDTLGMAKALEDMNALTASMNEGTLTEYVTLLTQIQSLLDAGLTEEEVQALFPEIDVSGQIQQIAELTKFIQDHREALEGLSGMFGEAIPEEVLKITTDLDMSGARQRWSEFADDPGAITTQAVIDGYEESTNIQRIQPVVDAFVDTYTEIPEGANTAELRPEGLLAYVEKYAEITTGADTSALTPDRVTAIVQGYEELASGADVSMLKPDEITAYISEYLAENGVDTAGLSPDGITATVLAYEEVSGGASTKALQPNDVAAIVTEYLQGKGVDISALTPPQIEAVVTAYGEATGCDKTELQAEVEARITSYTEATNTNKPAYIENYVSLVGYDMTAYNKFVEQHPIEVEGVVRLGERYKNPQDVLGDSRAKFYQDGVEIPVDLVPKDQINAGTLMALDSDGTMHVLITPEISGTAESVSKAAEAMTNKYVTTAIFGKEMHNDWGRLNNLLGSDLISWLNGFNGQLEAFEKNKGSWITLWGALDGTMLSGLDKQINQQFSGENLAGLTTYVSELVAAIKKGQEVSQEDIQNLQAIVNFLNNLELTGTGENIRAGIAQGMTEAGWSTDAESVARNLEAALNSALGISSPATRMMPIGAYVAAGVGEGMGRHDFSGNATAVAANLENSLGAAMHGEQMRVLGENAAQGLSAGMAGYDYGPSASASATRLQTSMGSAMAGSNMGTLGINAARNMAAPLASYDYSPTASASAGRLQAAMGAAINGQGFTTLGMRASQELSTSLAGYDYSPAAATSAARLQGAMSTAVNGQSFTALGMNAMQGLSASLAGYDYTPAAATSGSHLRGAMGTALNPQTLSPLGSNVARGIAGSMAGYDFTPAATASGARLQSSLGETVNGERFATLGANAMQGLSKSMTSYDYSSAVAASATRLKSTMGEAVNGERFAALGSNAMRGLSGSMAGYNMSATGSAVGSNVRQAVSSSLTNTTLRGVGVNAMNGLVAGINSGRAGVISAMRSAAREAVNAAKAELDIHSPSGVFRDEVGRMSMRGFGEGALLESKQQARIIRNAMNYITDSAQAGALGYSSNDNRRTYNQQSSVTLTGNTFYVRDERDIQSLAIEIATLTKRQHRGQGL